MMCLPPQNGLHSLRRERATSSNMDRSCRGARVQRAHTEDPSQGWSPTVGWEEREMQASLDVSSAGHKATFAESSLGARNPPTSRTYTDMRPSQEDDSTERRPSKRSSVTQRTWTGAAASRLLQLIPATAPRDTWPETLSREGSSFPQLQRVKSLGQLRSLSSHVTLCCYHPCGLEVTSGPCACCISPDAPLSGSARSPLSFPDRIPPPPQVLAWGEGPPSQHLVSIEVSMS